ncbi:MAG: DMT family transporter [Candidatus Omnitrophica bacterium]|nr:DMT family transporter [Candidatus Omnitrophota bacterium]
MNQLDQTARSILKMILAAVSFATMAIFVKLASDTVSSVEIVFFRSILGSLMIGAVIWKEKDSWIGLNPKVLVLRGVFGFVALSLHFYAIAKLDLGTAVMLNYTAPIFVVIFARFLLKEKITWKVNLAILVSFVGLYFLAGPQFQSKPIPIFLGLLSGIFAALAYVFIRFNGEDESPYTIIFYFTIISTIGSIPLLALDFHWPDTVEWVELTGVSIGAFFGQIYLTKSIQKAPVSFVLPFSYLTPVFCAASGALVWKEFLSGEQLVGSLIIIASGIAIYLFREKTSFVPIEE